MDRTTFTTPHPLLPTTLLIAMALIVTNALAQPRLDEIIVTAQLRNEPLLDVPVAMSVLSEQMLDDAGIVDIRGVAHAVPALETQTNTGPLHTGYRIRRVGNLSNIPTFDSAVGVYLDGAFRMRPLFGAADLIDIERIEILRGPQSTLYGKNASGGVIGLYTRKPTITPAAQIELTGGIIEGAHSAPLYRLRGGASTTLGSDALRASLALAYAGHDHTDESALTAGGEAMNEQNRLTARGQLYWERESTDIRLLLGHTTDDADNRDGDLYYDPNGWVANVILPTLQSASLSVPCSSNDAHDRHSCTRKAMHSELLTREATLIANHALNDDWTLTSITSADWYRFEGSWEDVVQLAAPLLRYYDTQESDSLQQQLRLTSTPGDPIDHVIGLFYYENRLHYGDGTHRPQFQSDSGSDHPAVIAINQALLGAAIPMAAPGQEGYLASTQDLQSYSAFWQADWHATSRFTLSAGVRWLHEQKKARIANGVNDSTPSVLSLLLSPTSVNGTLQRSTEGVSWSLTPRFQFSENHLLYATTARGIKPGGFNIGFGSLPLTQREFDDEHLTHYEGGLKSNLFAGRIQVSTALFLTTYDDYQDAAFIGGQFTVGNAEQTRLQGFELDISSAIGNHVDANLAISYADLVYERNSHGQCHPLRTPDSATDSSACDLAGEHPINAPLWRTHASLQWRQPAAGYEWFERFDWSWSSRYNTSFSADPLLQQQAYHWLDLRAGVRWSCCELSAWANNLLDETVVDNETVQNLYAGPGDGSTQSYLQDGRSYGLTLSLRL